MKNALSKLNMLLWTNIKYIISYWTKFQRTAVLLAEILSKKVLYLCVGVVVFHGLREIDGKLHTNILHELELEVDLLCEVFVVTSTASTPTCTICLGLFETIFVLAFQTQPLQFHLKEEESIQLFH